MSGDTVIVMEAGFKIIPGKERDFLAMQASMVPVATSQSGFVSVYGGPILDSEWLYFGVRFSSADQMDAWHHHSGHQAVQKMAYDKWWTAVYIRKWHSAAPGDILSDRLLCETRLTTTAALDDHQIHVLRSVLGELPAAGAKRFETLTGAFEPQPYQFAGPLEITPTPAGVTYALFTHWSSETALRTWQQSPAYLRLQGFGQVLSETFVAWKETGVRHRLRNDKLQRQWTLQGHP